MGMGMLGDPNLAHPLTGQKDGPAHLRTKVCYGLGLEGCDFVVLADWALKSDGTFGHVGSESCISPVHVLERPFMQCNGKLRARNLEKVDRRIRPRASLDRDECDHPAHLFLGELTGIDCCGTAGTPRPTLLSRASKSAEVPPPPRPKRSTRHHFAYGQASAS